MVATKNFAESQVVSYIKVKFKCYVKPMKDPPGVSPSKGNQRTTRGKEKIILTSVGIEPTTSGLDLPSLCRLSFEVGRRDDFNLHSRVNSLFHHLRPWFYVTQHWSCWCVSLLSLRRDSPPKSSPTFSVRPLNWSNVIRNGWCLTILRECFEMFSFSVM